MMGQIQPEKKMKKSACMLAALAALNLSLLAQHSLGPDLFESLRYRNIGPARGGRVTAVAGIPGRRCTFYMGASGGGVWKTVDCGIRWTNVSDGYFATPSIGAIRVAPSNPDIVWVGTGSDAIRSNVIRGLGVYRSIDAGGTWEFRGLKQAGQIGALLIHPRNPDLVYVAALGNPFGANAERGVFRTRDGGESWEKVLFVSERTGVVDLEFAPGDPRQIYASAWEAERKPWSIMSGGYEGGVFGSSDGGETWDRLSGGLPRGLVGKSDLAVSAADPDRLYVLMEAPGEKGGVYRSDDRGRTFRLISTEEGLLDRPFYYCNIDADPSNADVLYVNATRFYKSEDAGVSWKRIGTPHGDNHDMWINPRDSKLFIQSNDGGANVTLDGGRSWSTQSNQATAELYQVNVDDRFPYWVYAGQQDNSTIRVPSLPPHPYPGGPRTFWESIGGCETGPAVPRPGDANIVYSNCKGRFGRYNHLTGQEKQYYVGAANMYGHNPADLRFRFQRVSPIIVSPHDRNVIYHASQHLHRSTDEGVTWHTISPDLTANEPDKQVISGSPITRDITGEEFYSTIYSVVESTLRKGLIWVGANDGPVHLTRDGGQTWTRVTPSDLLPGGRVETVEASPHRASKAYLAVYRYLLDDWQPYIYRTDDFGQSWTRLTDGANGIPLDAPTRVVREDPDRQGLLYAGTDRGVYVSFDDGGRWHPLQQNLPVVPVTDLKVHRRDLVLSTMGRSFWILDDVTPLHQLTDAVLSGPHLFAPRAAYRQRFRSAAGSDAEPEYPPPAATVDYYLSADVPEVTMEFLDLEGNPIRSFSSRQDEPLGEADPGMRIEAEDNRPSRLRSSPGLHRFRWDMRHAGPWARPSGRRSGSGRGPLISPGSCRVRFTAGGWSATRELEIRIDPRVAADGVTGADLRSQEALSLEIRDSLSEARRLAERIGRRLEQLAARGDDPGSGEMQARLREAQARLTTAGERYPQPMIIDQLVYLASMLDRADQKPGRDAHERLEELQTQLSEIKELVEDKATDR